MIPIKPTYYLWAKDFASTEELTMKKDSLVNAGFRVVIFLDGMEEANIHDGLKAIIKNHFSSVFS